MRIIAKCLVGVAALLFFAAQSTATERPSASRTEIAKGKMVKKTVRAPLREYENVAGFKGRLNDPLYAYAAVPVPSRMGPVITQWPMANTVWW